MWRPFPIQREHAGRTVSKSADTKPGDSLLQRVAEHERSLLEGVAEARKAAQAVIDEARGKARALLDDDNAKLNAEVQAFRRDAEAARAASYQATVRAAETETAAAREYVKAHASEAARDVLTMILPGGSS